MSKLPNTAESISLLEAKQDAHDTVTHLIERNMELEEIFQNLQPLLYALSVKLYGDDDAPVSLGVLIEDSLKMLGVDQGTIQ